MTTTALHLLITFHAQPSSRELLVIRRHVAAARRDASPVWGRGLAKVAA